MPFDLGDVCNFGAFLVQTDLGVLQLAFMGLHIVAANSRGELKIIVAHFR